MNNEMIRQIVIDAERCIGCGKCADDCPAHLIRVENGKAVREDRRCIGCGHCFAVCPAGAVQMPEYIQEDIAPEDMTWIDSDRFLLAMKSRRSIRHFDNRPVEDEVIEKLLEAARYCPTSKNRQDLFITVIKDDIELFEQEAVSVFRRSQTEDLYCSKTTKYLQVTDHMFFLGAPLVLLFSARDPVNAALAEAYVELLAESMGLGCFHCGYFRDAVISSETLREMSGIPEKAEPVISLVLGYPDRNLYYSRIPPRRPANVVKK